MTDPCEQKLVFQTGLKVFPAVPEENVSIPSTYPVLTILTSRYGGLAQDNACHGIGVAIFPGRSR